MTDEKTRIEDLPIRISQAVYFWGTDVFNYEKEHDLDVYSTPSRWYDEWKGTAGEYLSREQLHDLEELRKSIPGIEGLIVGCEYDNTEATKLNLAASTPDGTIRIIKETQVNDYERNPSGYRRMIQENVKIPTYLTQDMKR